MRLWGIARNAGLPCVAKSHPLSGLSRRAGGKGI
jgi:hypothetical protein